MVAGSREKPPNIVLVMADNQPADMLGCYGNDEVHTPHLDALSQDGVRFDKAFCVNAMCSPCRASVLTGLMPSQHGIHNWLDDRLIDQWPEDWCAIGALGTLPQILKSAGYCTALIGKFHLGSPFRTQLSFDRWVTMPHGHTTSFHDTEIIEPGKRYAAEGHSVDFFTDKTIAFLEDQAGQDAPFFAFVPFNGPYGHWPAIRGRAANAFAELYDAADMHSIPREGLDDTVLRRFALRVQEGGLREQFKGPLLLPNNLAALRNYFSQVSLIDHSVGRIRSALQRLKLEENTVVIFTADHGFSLGHNGIWGHGAASFPASAHRPSYHIPLIMAGGPVAASRVSDDLVSQIDLFPTLAALAGSPEPPSLPSSACDLGPVLRGAGRLSRDAVFMEQEETRAVRTRDWLFASRFQGAPSHPMRHALYHLPSDPMETTDLADRPEHRETVARLQDRVDTFFDRFAVTRYDLWRGGSAKSNVTYEPLWADAWGPSWRPELGAALEGGG